MNTAQKALLLAGGRNPFPASLVITPTLGVELLTDPGFETWSSATNLTSWNENVDPTTTVNQEGTVKRTGNYSARVDVDASGHGYGPSQGGAAAAGTWLRAEVYARCNSTPANARIDIAGVAGPDVALTATDWTRIVRTGRAAGANPSIGMFRATTASKSIYLDDASEKAIDTASLFYALNINAVNGTMSAGITRAAGTQYGLAHYVDTDNFVIGYGDGLGNIILVKRVGGTYTQVATAAMTYSAGATMSLVRTSDQKYSVTYNGSTLISPQTISDATFDTATRWGLFSTYEGNTFASARFTA